MFELTSKRQIVFLLLVYDNDNGQFKHQTQPQHNPDFSTNDCWGCGKFSTFDWLSELGYIEFELTLQRTFGA